MADKPSLNLDEDAGDFQLNLESDVQFLKGVGPDRAALLQRLGIETVGDLLWYLPRDVLDFTDVRLPRDLEADKPQSVLGRVVDVDAKQLRNGRTLVAALIECEVDYARGIWFNQAWMRKRFVDGQLVLFSGKPKFNQNRWEFSHPQVQWLDDEESASGGVILTRYGLTEGLKVHQLRRMIANAIDSCGHLVEDHLPDSLLKRLELPSLKSALQGVHQPPDMETYERCRQRVLFDDLYEFQLGLALRRRSWRNRRNAPQLEVSAKIDARIRRLFPFSFTEGQDLAIKDLASDFKSGFAMHRLLQADVGAGKTVVAIYAMLVAVAHGWQAALMAPTELLATQHWQTLQNVLGDSHVKRALLTGSLGTAERRDVMSGIEDGSLQLVVGTQALIQSGVNFSKLGVVVIDEQHKFGVAQRAQFSATSEVPPHILVMTATPIPRTLCMTQFGDLDVTSVRDMPQGRQPVVTSRLSTSTQKRKAWDFIKDQLRTGRQLYVVCPLVESTSEAMADVASAEEIYRKMANEALSDFRVGLVHGRMDRGEREVTMDQFRQGELDALVATTVIEVGVDVPNATQTLILDAERFGLSQLHQLRGRVGRGRHRGYCFLVSDSVAPDAVSRLQAMESTTDGFELAERDFELRGPGDILGTRQHGALPLRFAKQLRDEDVLRKTRDEAFFAVRTGEIDSPEYSVLKLRVLERFAQLLDLPRSG